MTAKKTISSPRSRRRKSSSQPPMIKGFLFVLVVLLSLIIIAFAASHVYVRLNKGTQKPEIQKAIKSESEKSTLPPTDNNNLTISEFGPPSQENQYHTPAPEPLFSQESLLIGTWVNKKKQTKLYFEGDTYMIESDSAGKIQKIKGKYLISQGLITLSGSEDGSPCTNTEGTYAYAVSEWDLSLKLQSDPCKLRATLLSVVFEKP